MKLDVQERLGFMVDAEWNHRQSNKLARYIKIVDFYIPNATIEGIEYHAYRKLEKQKSYDTQPASKLMKDTISFLKALPVTEKHILVMH